MISIKLARHGLKNTPFYHIVVLQSRSRPTRKPIEQLGTYNPIPNKDGSKDISLNFERAKYWIGVGAKPSDSVARILAKVTKESPLSSMGTLNRNDRNALELFDAIPWVARQHNKSAKEFQTFCCCFEIVPEVMDMSIHCRISVQDLVGQLAY